MSIRPLDFVIDGVFIVVGIWLYGQYKYLQGKVEGRKETNK